MLKAGFARIDITPAQDQPLMGYSFRQEESLTPGNDGVLDPLYARVLALHDGTSLALLVSLDLCVLQTPLARQWRQQLAEAVGTDPTRVMLCCTHTHHGPFPEDSAEETPGTRYAEWLAPRLCEAAVNAVGLLIPVRAGVRQAACGLGYNRRFVNAEGVSHCWGPSEWPQRLPGTATDPVAVVIKLAPIAGGMPILLWSMSPHPVVLGKTYNRVSADYPGVACTQLDEMAGVRSLFCLGGAGDTHPWVATQNDPQGVDLVARAAAAQIALMAATMHCVDVDASIQTACTTVDAAHDLQVWRIGPLRFAALPGELFGCLASRLRATQDGPLLLASCSNGWSGYWPTREAFAEGGYEIDVAETFKIDSGKPEAWVDQLAEMLKSIS